MSASTPPLLEYVVSDGVAVIEMAPTSPPPALADLAGAWQAAIDRLTRDSEEIEAVLITSRGAFGPTPDGCWLQASDGVDATRLLGDVLALGGQLERLSAIGVPVAAVVRGDLVGLGLDIAMAAHRTFTSGGGVARGGLGGLSWGLIPPCGGLALLVRRVGVEKAAALLVPEDVDLGDAGLVHALRAELLGDEERAQEAAREWARHAAVSGLPEGDDPGRIAGPSTEELSATGVLPTLAAKLHRRLRGSGLKAPRNALAAAVEGAQVDFATARLVEARYFVELVLDQQFGYLSQLHGDLQDSRYNVEVPPGGAVQDQDALAMRLCERIDRGRAAGTERPDYVVRLCARLIEVAAGLVARGEGPVFIDRAARRAGFVLGPGELCDRIGIDRARWLLAIAEPGADQRPAAEAEGAGVLARVSAHHRGGASAGADDIAGLLMHHLALEAVACLADGTVRSQALGNVESVWELGFPALWGGALASADRYSRGGAA